MTDTADWLRMYAQQLEDQHAPQNLTIGMRQAADQLDASRETTLQLLGQVGQLSDELERLKDGEARLRLALELAANDLDDWGAYTKANNARAAMNLALEEAAKVCDPKGDCSEQDAYGKSFAAAIRALKEEKDVYTT